MAEKILINKDFNGEFEIMIKHQLDNGYELQTPVVEDGVEWETEAKGAPGKLTFKVLKDDSGNLNFQEGDLVALKYKDSVDGWVIPFCGYIFSKKRNKKGWIDVTAYDQLRYFKNKATYVYTNKKASELIKMLADDYNLNVGTIDDTNYVIGQRIEDDVRILDIAQNALDLTLIGGGKKYILYDDAGKLCLRDAENLKTNVVVDESTAEDFDYKSSIDDETYTEVELYFDNDETNKREYYNIYNKSTMGQWGRLRYTESIDNPANAKTRVRQLLKLYSRKSREIKAKKTFGDYRCRGGASVITNLLLGDVDVNTYAFIESAKHTFSKNNYRMDLTLTVDLDEKYNSTDEIYNESNIIRNVVPKSSVVEATTVATPIAATFTNQINYDDTVLIEFEFKQLGASGFDLGQRVWIRGDFAQYEKEWLRFEDFKNKSYGFRVKKYGSLEIRCFSNDEFTHKCPSNGGKSTTHKINVYPHDVNYIKDEFPGNYSIEWKKNSPGYLGLNLHKINNDQDGSKPKIRINWIVQGCD